MIACAFESDDEPERRTWKATVRTQNDRGEVVYQASFVPPVSSGVSEEASCVCIPWSEFRLVRGPVVVPGVPPLSKDRCDSVYGLGLIMSRFGPRGPMPDFREGPFRLALRGLGVFSDSPSDASPPALDLVAAVAENAGKKSSENRGTRNVVTWILAPLIKVAFSESRRRRRRARALLKERFGVGALRARFGEPSAVKLLYKPDVFTLCDPERLFETGPRGGKRPVPKCPYQLLPGAFELKTVSKSLTLAGAMAVEPWARRMGAEEEDDENEKEKPTGLGTEEAPIEL